MGVAIINHHQEPSITIPHQVELEKSSLKKSLPRQDDPGANYHNAEDVTEQRRLFLAMIWMLDDCWTCWTWKGRHAENMRKTKGPSPVIGWNHHWNVSMIWMNSNGIFMKKMQDVKGLIWRFDEFISILWGSNQQKWNIAYIWKMMSWFPMFFPTYIRYIPIYPHSSTAFAA